MSDKKSLTQVTDFFPEIKDLTNDKNFQQLVEVMPEHEKMLQVIQAGLPEVQRASSLFYKTQSQFMDNMMTVSHMTPIQNMRQILAEMVKVREAIQEATLKLKKKDVERRIKQRELDQETDPLKAEMLEIEIVEILTQTDTTRSYISGAIRKLANYTENYNLIAKTHGVENFNEADFEANEERHHIMKAFEQALCAARANGGRIDEGNHIYLFQVGVNGAHAQAFITRYLDDENKLISEGIAPTHEMVRQLLEHAANTFAGSAKKFAEYKGVRTVNDVALIEKGDQRLMLAKHDKDQA